MILDSIKLHGATVKNITTVFIKSPLEEDKTITAVAF